MADQNDSNDLPVGHADDLWNKAADAILDSTILNSPLGTNTNLYAMKASDFAAASADPEAVHDTLVAMSAGDVGTRVFENGERIDGADDHIDWRDLLDQHIRAAISPKGKSYSFAMPMGGREWSATAFDPTPEEIERVIAEIGAIKTYDAKGGGTSYEIFKVEGKDTY